MSIPQIPPHEKNYFLITKNNETISANFQINIPMNKDDRIALLSKVNTIAVFPMMWVDEGADIDEVKYFKVFQILDNQSSYSSKYRTVQCRDFVCFSIV